MFQFSYNSYHKIITASIVVIWAIWHFAGESEAPKIYDNGQVKKTGGFSNGKNHGKWTWYYDNGQKKMQGTFIHGKRNGTWITWDKYGRKLTEGNYEKDRLNGTFIRWNAEGEIEEHLVYRNDIVVELLKSKQE